MSIKRIATQEQMYPPKKRALYEHMRQSELSKCVSMQSEIPKVDDGNGRNDFMSLKIKLECSQKEMTCMRPRSDSFHSIHSMLSDPSESIASTSREASPNFGLFESRTPERNMDCTFKPGISKPLFPTGCGRSDLCVEDHENNSKDLSSKPRVTTSRQASKHAENAHSGEGNIGDPVKHFGINHQLCQPKPLERMDHTESNEEAISTMTDENVFENKENVSTREVSPKMNHENRRGMDHLAKRTNFNEENTRMGPMISLLSRFNQEAVKTQFSQQTSCNTTKSKQNINDNHNGQVTAKSLSAQRDGLSLDLKSNRVLLSSGRGYKCRICNKDFEVHDQLKSHMKKDHSGPQPYKCEHCPRAFSQYNNLQRHLRVHRAKIYKCSLCDREFNEEFYLKMHMGTHTGKRVYSCGVCNATFTSNQDLKRHVKTHTPSQLHTCEVCGKSFSKACVLRQHRKGHTGERPHKCEKCPKTFIHRHHLTMHLRSHTGDKQYVCEVCKKVFYQSSHLYKHLRAHEEDGEISREAIDEMGIDSNDNNKQVTGKISNIRNNTNRALTGACKTEADKQAQATRGRLSIGSKTENTNPTQKLPSLSEAFVLNKSNSGLSTTYHNQRVSQDQQVPLPLTYNPGLMTHTVLQHGSPSSSVQSSLTGQQSALSSRAPSAYPNWYPAYNTQLQTYYNSMIMTKYQIQLAGTHPWLYGQHPSIVDPHRKNKERLFYSDESAEIKTKQPPNKCQSTTMPDMQKNDRDVHKVSNSSSEKENGKGSGEFRCDDGVKKDKSHYHTRTELAAELIMMSQRLPVPRAGHVEARMTADFNIGCETGRINDRENNGQSKDEKEGNDPESGNSKTNYQSNHGKGGSEVERFNKTELNYSFNHGNGSYETERLIKTKANYRLHHEKRTSEDERCNKTVANYRLNHGKGASFSKTVQEIVCKAGNKPFVPVTVCPQRDVYGLGSNQQIDSRDITSKHSTLPDDSEDIASKHSAWPEESMDFASKQSALPVIVSHQSDRAFPSSSALFNQWTGLANTTQYTMSSVLPGTNFTHTEMYSPHSLPYSVCSSRPFYSDWPNYIGTYQQQSGNYSPLSHFSMSPVGARSTQTASYEGEEAVLNEERTSQEAPSPKKRHYSSHDGYVGMKSGSALNRQNGLFVSKRQRHMSETPQAMYNDTTHISKTSQVNNEISSKIKTSREYFDTTPVNTTSQNTAVSKAYQMYNFNTPFCKTTQVCNNTIPVNKSSHAYRYNTRVSNHDGARSKQGDQSTTGIPVDFKIETSKDMSDHAVYRQSNESKSGKSEYLSDSSLHNIYEQSSRLGTVITDNCEQNSGNVASFNKTMSLAYDFLPEEVKGKVAEREPTTEATSSVFQEDNSEELMETTNDIRTVNPEPCEADNLGRQEDIDMHCSSNRLEVDPMESVEDSSEERIVKSEAKGENENTIENDTDLQEVNTMNNKLNDSLEEKTLEIDLDASCENCAVNMISSKSYVSEASPLESGDLNAEIDKSGTKHGNVKSSVNGDASNVEFHGVDYHDRRKDGKINFATKDGVNIANIQSGDGECFMESFNKNEMKLTATNMPETHGITGALDLSAKEATSSMNEEPEIDNISVEGNAFSETVEQGKDESSVEMNDFSNTVEQGIHELGADVKGFSDINENGTDYPETDVDGLSDASVNLEDQGALDLSIGNQADTGSCSDTKMKHKVTRQYEAYTVKETRVLSGSDLNNVCGICWTRFDNPLEFESHQVEHAQRLGTSNKCQYCKKEFSRSFDLQCHLLKHRQHTSETGKGQNSDMRVVKGSKRKEDRHLCCKSGTDGKETQLYRLPANQEVNERSIGGCTRTQDEEQSYKCEICSREFTHKHNLNRHKMAHNDKSYPCGICDRSFKEKFYLQMHVKTHTEDQTRPCEICGKFVPKTQMWQHTNEHLGNIIQNPTYQQIDGRVREILKGKGVEGIMNLNSPNSDNVQKNVDTCVSTNSVTRHIPAKKQTNRKSSKDSLCFTSENGNGIEHDSPKSGKKRQVLGVKQMNQNSMSVGKNVHNQPRNMMMELDDYDLNENVENAYPLAKSKSRVHEIIKQGNSRKDVFKPRNGGSGIVKRISNSIYSE